MSKRVKQAVKEIRKYEEVKRDVKEGKKALNTKALDEFFAELEANPLAHLKDGFDPLAVEMKTAWLEMNRAKREVTVLIAQVDALLDKIAAIVFSMMENPLAGDDEMTMAIISDLQLRVDLLEDKIKDHTWDAEFYEWWLSEVKRDEFFAAEQRDELLSGEGNLETAKYCAGLERAYDE